MKWAALAKKILTSTETRTDETDERLIRSTFVSNGSAHFTAFPEKNGNQDAISAVPANISTALKIIGYENNLINWSPSACKALLDMMVGDCPDFHVNGWHGCQMPESWSWSVQSAVMSVYVRSMQDGHCLQ